MKHSQPAQKDALRALTQRGHDSVYQKAHASESNDELAGPGHVAGLNRKVRREKASMGSLKRASADVELLAPRSPMGKETMVTFSNTLPRAATNTAEELGNGVGVGGVCVGVGNGGSGTTQRHMTFHVPMDPQRSKQLVSEWRQKSIEMRSLSLKDDELNVAATAAATAEGGVGVEVETTAGGGSAGGVKEEQGGSSHSTLYPTVQAANRGAQPGPGGARVVLPPRPPGAPPLVHIPEEASRPPPVSPKSATTRAKWLSMEKSAIPAATPEPPRLPAQPRVAQVMAMSKQHGALSISSKSSDVGGGMGSGGGGGGGGSSCATSSTGSESPYYRIPSDRDSGSIVTIDAHAPHHPVVRLSSGNGNPWDWMSAANGSSGGAHEAKETSSIHLDGTKTLHRQDSISIALRDYHRPATKADSVGSSASDSSRELPLPPPPHPDLLLDSGHSHPRSHSLSRHSPLHRKPSMSARDWDPQDQPPQVEPDHFFKNLQTDSLSRRYKD